jgi:hypothetical protein
MDVEEVGGGVGDKDEEGSVVDGDTVDGETVRTIKRFDFEVAEFAVDPGQDLLVVVEVRYAT